MVVVVMMVIVVVFQILLLVRVQYEPIATLLLSTVTLDLVVLVLRMQNYILEGFEHFKSHGMEVPRVVGVIILG